MTKTLYAVACCLICFAPVWSGSAGNSSKPAKGSTPQTKGRSALSQRSTSGRSATLEGWATFYTVESCKKERWGNRTPLMANGKPLNDSLLTCAMPGLPTGRLYRVTMLNGAATNSVVVRHQDRGPGMKAQKRGVIIDLTSSAMMVLAGEKGMKQGKVMVTVRLESVE